MSAATRSSGGAGRSRSGRPALAWRRAAAGLLVLAVLALAAAPTHADDPPAAGTVSAQNVTIVIQVLWQVQEGCRQYCYGTQQTQSASQSATTVQLATATATGTAAGAPASASNTTITIQLVIQSQLGCVAFCYGTSSEQLAVQGSDVAQVADAVSSAAASATNTALVTQLAWQFQTACAQECHDATATQDASQASSILQSALGGAGGAPDVGAFTAWLAQVAGGAVIDIVQQIDEAACSDHCVGDVQVQVGVQADGLAQTTEATGPAAAPPAGIAIVLAPGGRVRHVAAVPAATVAAAASHLAAAAPAAARAATGVLPVAAPATAASRPRPAHRHHRRPRCVTHHAGATRVRGAAHRRHARAHAKSNTTTLKFSIGGNRCGS